MSEGPRPTTRLTYSATAARRPAAATALPTTKWRLARTSSTAIDVSVFDQPLHRR